VEDPLPRAARELNLGTDIYRAPAGPTITKPLLRDQIFETSLEEANSVGNIYYANYYVFQGRIRDHFFHEIAPEYFRGTGEQGELRCTYCRVDHLREAMPFDHIAVQLRLESLQERGVRFLVEYFRHDPDGQRTKLAFGVHEAAWVAPSTDHGWQPSPLPQVFRDALLKRAGERRPEGTGFQV
jgi:acyl-CoA thioesterase FadM